MDLATSPEVMKKFVRIKGYKLWRYRVLEVIKTVENYFRMSSPLNLNRVQKMAIKILIVLLIMMDAVVACN